MPKSGSYQGAIDLSSDTAFTEYYKDIDDYEIEVDTMTVEEYQKLFNADKRFVYDYTKVDTDGSIAFPTEYSDEQMEIYTNYDLIVMGFGESYAGVNINNYYGAVDFLRFYLQEGLSILFTHDQTSVYNTNKDAAGYTMNTLMRDLMGMNRYQTVNRFLPDAEHDRLLTYQNEHDYDTVTSVNDGSALEEKHGYTYYAMKRLGANSNETQSMPYKKLTGFNAMGVKLDCSLYYEVDGKRYYIDSIFRNDGSGTQKARRDVKFYITNNRTRLPGKTSLDLNVRALFRLD